MRCTTIIRDTSPHQDGMMPRELDSLSFSLFFYIVIISCCCCCYCSLALGLFVNRFWSSARIECTFTYLRKVVPRQQLLATTHLLNFETTTKERIDFQWIPVYSLWYFSESHFWSSIDLFQKSCCTTKGFPRTALQNFETVTKEGSTPSKKRELSSQVRNLDLNSSHKQPQLMWQNMLRILSPCIQLPRYRTSTTTKYCKNITFAVETNWNDMTVHKQKSSKSKSLSQESNLWRACQARTENVQFSFLLLLCM